MRYCGIELSQRGMRCKHDFGRCILSQSKVCGPNKFPGALTPRPPDSIALLFTLATPLGILVMISNEFISTLALITVSFYLGRPICSQDRDQLFKQTHRYWKLINTHSLLLKTSRLRLGDKYLFNNFVANYLIRESIFAPVSREHSVLLSKRTI